jgi:3-deoxy-D-manno-octulosonic-acid transferase
MRHLLDIGYCATLLPHYYYHRIFTSKYGVDVAEKLGHILSLENSFDGKTLWVHAVSVGETLAARPLIKLFKEKHPDWRIVFSTTTATGREVAKKNFPDDTVIYFPLDISWVLKKVFNIVKPSLIILMELEIWPNFLEEAEEREIPVIVSNLRITERSERNFQKFGSWAKSILGKISCWCSQNSHYAEVIKRLGVDENKIHEVGSLKYDGLDFSEDKQTAAQLKKELGGGSIFLAGSTHAGEDEIVYEAFVRLRKKFGDEWKLCLVPRHPERCEEVVKLAPENMSVHRRSAGFAGEGTDIVIGDIMGELGGMYRAADVVFIGGTLLSSVGGHNMLEPAAFAKPILYGTHVFNFAEPSEVLINAGGAIMFEKNDADGLYSALERVVDFSEEAEKMGLAAKEAARSMQGATAKTIELIESFI